MISDEDDIEDYEYEGSGNIESRYVPYIHRQVEGGKSSSSVNPRFAITNVRSLAPNVTDTEAIQLLPQNGIYRQEITCELHNVYVSVAKALERTLHQELPSKILTFDYRDYSTDNVYSHIEYIKQRIENIYILQNTNDEFFIDIVNDKPYAIFIYSSDIRSKKNPDKKITAFNENVKIELLHPGKKFKISSIRVHEDYGYKNAAHNCIIAPRTIPINMDICEFPSTISCPMNHKLMFEIKGIEDHKSLLTRACRSILQRLANLENTINEEVQNLSEGSFTISGETDTISHMLAEFTNRESTVTAGYNVDKNVRTTIFRYTKPYDDEQVDVKKVMLSMVDKLIKIFNAIERQI
jgi:DNA-directed RNA polymerase subunit L